MANHFVFLILDSCRYDSFTAAHTPNFDRIGKAQLRWSYASWTAPSHYTFLMGMMPHASPTRVFASEVYKEEFAQWVQRLEVPELSFRSFLPQLSLPKVLADLGYHCVARVSLPVLNPHTPLAAHFHDYQLMGSHNEFARMVEEIEFPRDEPHFYFLNLGETHYPYMLDGAELPHLCGVHGVYRELARGGDAGEGAGRFFDAAEMRRLHRQQITCVEHVDRLFGELLAKAPTNTYFVVTGDHGELFGEDGYFGHGPIMHEKVFQVPFIEGKVG